MNKVVTAWAVLVVLVVCTLAKKVAILGGGVGGLSAALELADRGYQVEVYDRQEVFGGKARSIPFKGTGKDGRGDLPAEHVCSLSLFVKFF
jgi:uncharacterized protein with NAD-binding domain and iron-sulfur cluster